MHSFYTYITELFDKPAEWIYAGEHYSEGEFIYHYKEPINDKFLVVYFKRILNNKTFSVRFTVNDDDHVTGGGDQQLVFATVIDVMKDFEKRFKPTKLMFTASKNRADSRTKLYQRLVKKFGKQFGYKMDLEDRNTNDLFVLTKD